MLYTSTRMAPHGGKPREILSLRTSRVRVRFRVRFGSELGLRRIGMSIRKKGIREARVALRAVSPPRGGLRVRQG